MKTKHKAKDLEGNWVEGYYWNDKGEHWIMVSDSSCPAHEISPSTLCERVRGTDFFEGDEITDGSGNRGVIVWNQDSCGFLVDFYDHGLDELGDWAKKTGKNIHDNER